MAKKIKEPKILTEEEKAIEKVKSVSNILRENNIPYPPASRSFKIGDLVQYGNHPNAQVVNVYEQGKVYELRIWGEYFSYGNSVGQKEFYSLVEWTSLMPIYSKLGHSALIQNTDIRLYYSHMMLDSAIHCYYSFGIDMNPSYQREFVWSLEDNVALIDSIYCNRTIGSYILCHNGYEDDREFGYEILDGKQRLKAIIDFYEDKFKYKGYLYSELSPTDRIFLERVSFPRAEIKNATLEQKIRTFIHVNTTGKHMSPEHLEKVKGMLK